MPQFNSENGKLGHYRRVFPSRVFPSGLRKAALPSP
jgi:hypothetical protein